MDILGVGPLEFVFIVILMLLVLGPRGMVKAVRDVGEFLRKLVQSPTWKAIINSSQEIREVQTQIIKESGLDESLKEIRASTKTINQMTNNIIRPTLDAAKVDSVNLNVPKNTTTNPVTPAETAAAAVSAAETVPDPAPVMEAAEPIEEPAHVAVEPETPAPSEPPTIE